jgi:hypothetical protein
MTHTWQYQDSPSCKPHLALPNLTSDDYYRFVSESESMYLYVAACHQKFYNQYIGPFINRVGLANMRQFAAICVAGHYFLPVG